jgi:LuxR family maltose regulon positive regulatory protein
MTRAAAARARSPRRDEAPAADRTTVDLRLPKPPPAVVLRPRLFDLLDAGAADHALTLVSGPPGAGKTVLLTSWLRERPPDARVAWVSVRESDRAGFWQQLLDALRPSLGREMLLFGLDAPGDDASPEFVERFVEAAGELDRPVVFVVDDLHLAAPRAIAALDRVLRTPPPQLRFVVASRIDPALALHVLRVTGDLAEIRAQELALDDVEAREFLDAMDLDLREDQLASVLRRTEGWAAGLRLFGLSLQAGRNDVDVVERFTVDERPASEFLAAEVLAIQPDEIRMFLLRTSIVDSLDGELANELSGRSDGERVLEQLFHDNVFLERVSGDGRVYRYHQLFGALLRAEASYELHDELAELHERAAICLARRGRAARAVQHAVDAGRWELVAGLLAEHWSAVLVSVGSDGPRYLLDAVPPQHADASPVVAAFNALSRVSSSNARGEAALLADAQSRRDAVPATARPGFDALIRYASALAARSRGNFAQSAKLAAAGLEQAPVETASAESEDQRRALGLATLGVAQLWLGSPKEAQATLEEAVDVAQRTGTTPAEMDALAHLALLELDAGQLRRAARIARAALDLDRVHAQPQPSGVVARIVLALVQYEWGDLDVAQAALASADAITRRTGDVPGRVLGAIAAASVALSESGDAADDALLHLRAVRRRSPAAAGALEGRIAALEARLLAKTARLDEARAAIAVAAPDPDVAVAGARIELALGAPAAALEILAERRPARPYVEIEAHVTEAIAQRAAGDDEAALAALGAALALAEPEAVRRPFVDAGSALRDLLSAHLRRTNAHRWLAAELAAYLDGRNATDGVAPAELLEALSDRESEVLHYLPTIMSNADIAAELFVSVNTVKTHVKSIYRKLGATRRQDAVRRARQLRLI